MSVSDSEFHHQQIHVLESPTWLCFPLSVLWSGGGACMWGGTPVHAPMRTPLPVSLNKMESLICFLRNKGHGQAWLPGTSTIWSKNLRSGNRETMPTGSGPFTGDEDPRAFTGRLML